MTIDRSPGPVVAIGNFDGVHKGHRALITTACNVAEKTGTALAAITFDPHPRRFFRPHDPPFLITRPATKERRLKKLGVQNAVQIPFTESLSRMEAEDFVRTILQRDIGASHVVVGEDFTFGHGRSGTVKTLRNLGMSCTAVPLTCNDGGAVYSSSLVRTHLQKGDMSAAAEILGWRWHIESEVVHGDKRGRTLGFPTANQRIPEYVQIPYGVWAVCAQVEGENIWRNAVANFGIRPMFQTREPIFETHLFDFAQDIYGRVLRVMPIRHLRAEMSFPDIDGLQRQMKDDCGAAQAVLESADWHEEIL